MKKYDLDNLINRKDTSSVKWDENVRIFGRGDVLPMWVADMDFQAPLEVSKAIMEKANHGVYGYTTISPSVHDAVKGWFQDRHGWSLNPEWFTYISGVVPALSATIQAFSDPEDKIILFSPVYYPFYDMIINNGRKLLTSPMNYKEGRYHMDLEHFESQLDGSVKMLLLCNPHNPGGTVWTYEELKQLSEICVKHGIVVVTDEIHADLVFKGHAYTPFASISEEIALQTVTCIAPTKTFNIAGLQASLMVTPNQAMREKLEVFMKKQGHFTLNIFGIVAMEAAYRHGAEWLEEVMEYIEENMDLAVSFIQKEIPGVSAAKPEGTYLLWIDCTSLGLKDDELTRLLVHKGKLALDAGKKFGNEADGFIRMNVACTRSTLLDGLERLKQALES